MQADKAAAVEGGGSGGGSGEGESNDFLRQKRLKIEEFIFCDGGCGGACGSSYGGVGDSVGGGSSGGGSKGGSGESDSFSCQEKLFSVKIDKAFWMDLRWDGRTDGQTDGRTYGGMDGRTGPLLETL